jgi:hypothetical protein
MGANQSSDYEYYRCGCCDNPLGYIADIGTFCEKCSYSHKINNKCPYYKK